MRDYGMVVRLVGISLTMFFGACSILAIIFLGFVYPGDPPIWDDTFALSIIFGVPIALTMLGVCIITIGRRMMKGKSRIAGGIIVFLLGALLLFTAFFSAIDGEFHAARFNTGAFMSAGTFFVIAAFVFLTAGTHILRGREPARLSAAGLGFNGGTKEDRARRERNLKYGFCIGVPLIIVIYTVFYIFFYK